MGLIGSCQSWVFPANSLQGFFMASSSVHTFAGAVLPWEGPRGCGGLSQSTVGIMPGFLEATALSEVWICCLPHWSPGASPHIPRSPQLPFPPRESLREATPLSPDRTTTGHQGDRSNSAGGSIPHLLPPIPFLSELSRPSR